MAYICNSDARKAVKSTTLTILALISTEMCFSSTHPHVLLGFALVRLKMESFIQKLESHHLHSTLVDCHPGVKGLNGPWLRLPPFHTKRGWQRPKAQTAPLADILNEITSKMAEGAIQAESPGHKIWPSSCLSVHTFTHSHVHIFTRSHLHTFTPPHVHTFTRSHLELEFSFSPDENSRPDGSVSHTWRLGVHNCRFQSHGAQ